MYIIIYYILTHILCTHVYTLKCAQVLSETSCKRPFWKMDRSLAKSVRWWLSYQNTTQLLGIFRTLPPQPGFNPSLSMIFLCLGTETKILENCTNHQVTRVCFNMGLYFAKNPDITWAKKSHSHPFPYNGSNILNQSTVNQISINKNHYPIFCSDVSTKSCILDATCGVMVGSLALALELFSQNHADLALLPLVQGESWPDLNGHGHHFIMPNSWGNDWNDDVLFVWIYFFRPY